MVLGHIHLILLFDTELQSSSMQIWTALVGTKYPSFHTFFNFLFKRLKHFVNHFWFWWYVIQQPFINIFNLLFYILLIFRLLRTSPSFPNSQNKIVKKRLLAHLISNFLLNPFQSAYTKFYSTETTLISLHDHLSNAIAKQQVSCLCLLHLSAALNTLDHSILLHRLSTWFGITSDSLHIAHLP